MTQNATVKYILEDGWAEVAVKRESACSHACSDCRGGCPGNSRSLIVKAQNLVGAVAGDCVVIESKTGEVLSAAILVYMLPILFLITALTVSYSAGASEAVNVLSGLISFTMGCAAVVFINRKVRRDKPIVYTIVSVS